jgi:hypothetical protein
VPETSLSDKLLGNFSVAPRRSAYVLRTSRNRPISAQSTNADGGRKLCCSDPLWCGQEYLVGSYQIKSIYQIYVTFLPLIIYI